MRYPISFRIRLPKRRGFWCVVIHATLANLHAHREGLGATRNRRVTAFCAKRRPPIRGGERGTLVFCKAHAGSGVVAHECFHAAFEEITRRRKTLNRRSEELMARTLEELVRGYWRQIYRRFPSGRLP